MNVSTFVRTAELKLHLPNPKWMLQKHTLAIHSKYKTEGQISVYEYEKFLEVSDSTLQ